MQKVVTFDPRLVVRTIRNIGKVSNGEEDTGEERVFGRKLK